MKTAIMKASWLRLHPGLRIDAGFWVLVNEIFQERKIDANAATDAEALEAIKEAEKRLEANVETSKSLRARAQMLQREAQELDKAPKPTRKPKPYQPKTGAKCGCTPGQQRDNCPNCEGTGWVIDFKAIRDRNDNR